jgi:hypothetical protein
VLGVVGGELPVDLTLAGDGGSGSVPGSVVDLPALNHRERHRRVGGLIAGPVRLGSADERAGAVTDGLAVLGRVSSRCGGSRAGLFVPADHRPGSGTVVVVQAATGWRV